jgi:hypothetical protein
METPFTSWSICTILFSEYLFKNKKRKKMKSDSTNTLARELVRNDIIQKAVDAANAVILEGSDGSVEETNYLTAQVGYRLTGTAISQFQSALLARDMNIGVSRSIVLKDGTDTREYCPAGKEYCYVCGHVDDVQVFLKENKCPNPECPSPDNWSD